MYQTTRAVYKNLDLRNALVCVITQPAVVISNPNNNLQDSSSQLHRAGTMKSLKSEGSNLVTNAQHAEYVNYAT